MVDEWLRCVDGGILGFVLSSWKLFLLLFFPLCGCESAEVLVSAKTIHAKNEKTTANGMNLKTKLCRPAGNGLSKFFNSNESKHPEASIP